MRLRQVTPHETPLFYDEIFRSRKKRDDASLPSCAFISVFIVCGGLRLL